MDYSSNQIDMQYLMSVPFAFVLQNNPLEEIEQFCDANGWNLLHHVVAEGDIHKISELIHFSFNPNINSKTNFIPENIFQIQEKRKTDKTKIFQKIPFSLQGFTPIHLSLFLYNYYQKLSDDFFYQALSDKYKKIIDLFIKNVSDIKTIQDSTGNSLFDYAFLMESQELIDLMQMHDPFFETLNNIQLKTAHKILEIMSLKYEKKDLDYISSCLQKKIEHDNLSKKLNHKNNESKKTTHKI